MLTKCCMATTHFWRGHIQSTCCSTPLGLAGNYRGMAGSILTMVIQRTPQIEGNILIEGRNILIEGIILRFVARKKVVVSLR